MKIILLPTDILFFMVIIGIIITCVMMRLRPDLRIAWQKLIHNKTAIIACAILSIYFLIAVLDSMHFSSNHEIYSVLDKILAPLTEGYEKTYSAPLATHSYVKDTFINEQGVVTQTYPKLNHIHLLGTDKVGNDVFYESIKSIRTALILGTLSTLVMLPFAVFLGLTAGYFKGWVDDIVQYVYTTLSSIPGVLLIAAAILSLQIFIANHPNFFSVQIYQADARLLGLCVILGITSWTTLCRLLRGETLKLSEIGYVQAAKTLGGSSGHILLRHILPNIFHIVIIVSVLDFTTLVLAETVLSYIGVGVDPSTYSWGNMINAARMELSREPIVWWPLIAALILMFILVLAANLLADALRDAFDPRLQ